MKPLNLFYVITGILGIGSMDTAGIDLNNQQESIEITTNNYSTDLQSDDTLYFYSNEE